MNRVVVALKMSRRLPDFVFQAEFIANCLANDPIYAGSMPPLAVFEAHVAALRQAEQNVRTRAIGSARARDAALTTVRTDLLALCSFVQHLAAASPEAGPAIVENAGMSVKNATGPVKSGFVVKQRGGSGTAHLVARAEATRASYDWQCSPDGETWLSLASTLQAHQEASGLAPGHVYFFRYRALTKGGGGDWSQVVSLRVL